VNVPPSRNSFDIYFWQTRDNGFPLEPRDDHLYSRDEDGFPGIIARNPGGKGAHSSSSASGDDACKRTTEELAKLCQQVGMCSSPSGGLHNVSHGVLFSSMTSSEGKCTLTNPSVCNTICSPTKAEEDKSVATGKAHLRRPHRRDDDELLVRGT
jgi:hypothetical protein